MDGARDCNRGETDVRLFGIASSSFIVGTDSCALNRLQPNSIRTDIIHSIPG